jgi:hypothetical protein
VFGYDAMGRSTLCIYIYWSMMWWGIVISASNDEPSKAYQGQWRKVVSWR